MRTALIIGVAGEALSADEVGLIKSTRPVGLILFARNCREHDQIRSLVDSFREALEGSPALVLIDQEGGRVQRLRPPLGRALPPAAVYGAIYDQDPELAGEAARCVARLMAEDLRALGIDTDCAPVLDVPVPGAHDIIGDRAYGPTPGQVASLGLAVANGLMAGGVLPVMKHIPGHGRALSDSHLELPIVTTAGAELAITDFAPFKTLAHLPAAMTAHVVFTSIDPGAPASTSEIVINDVIRREIGFDGLLMSDDLGMKALTGSIASRAEAVIRAGSDVALHCSGVFGEIAAAADGAGLLDDVAARRFDRAVAVTTRRDPFDPAHAEAVLAEVLASHAPGAESV